ncbi:glutathione S-transferase family protein [Ancylobacter dichloromethanicus]|uniref:Glutathione S-transferase n=1 Tax=Ancylobacter dichloromethanicus TaxID=518825 RepID=A0A9W6MYC3_9HYPH|nr:glutathione S-transferase family protein [Ancylobacter dichloromethanicus]MBS7553795.1 glutathione S-transferase family protein [Ancylobacter dichloromethanicus]GLK70901.1 glutathione S-transferase [Ancylobacter dichloromethanicus]
MKLRSSPLSPFGRKVKIGAILCDLHLDVVAADTSDPADPLRAQNPLGKIPVLLRDEGAAIYDSRVIMDYLDMQAGGGVLIPAHGEARIAALTLMALGDGIADAALLQVYESRFRDPGTHGARWMDHQAGKVTRGLAALEAAPPTLLPVTAAAHVGEIAVACALGYLDLRFAGTWRAAHPALVGWLDAFSERVPAFEATTPPV